MLEYINSEESYKGFVLKMRCFRYTEPLKNTGWHRECQVFKDGERMAICKTKKEAKDLILNGAFSSCD